MNNNNAKPTPEAKALSLFLMAFKTTKPIYKEQAKRINKQWDLVKSNKLSTKDYMQEVLEMLNLYGGYSKVIEETVWFYVKKTGEWNLKGDDQYCQDARKIADRIMSER